MYADLQTDYGVSVQPMLSLSEELADPMVQRFS